MLKAKWVYATIIFMGCHALQDSLIEVKNKCVENQLVDFKVNQLYQRIVQSFEDTFKVWRSNVSLFGVKEYRVYQLDEALFLSKDKQQCVLVLLSRTDKDSLIFGSARIINGVQNGDRWVFKANQEYNFDKGYYNKYSNNSFENLSELGRYCVLMAGNPPKAGCEIDESYWFK